MSANAWPVVALAALGMGAAYYATREPPTRRPKTKDDAPDDDTDDGGGGAVSGPGGISTVPGKPPPEPTGGWDAHLTEDVAKQALQEVREEQTATTGKEAVRQALQKVFGIAWVEPLATWQKKAKSRMWSALQDMSEWRWWTEEKDAPNDMPYVWWLQSNYSVSFCRNTQGVAGTEQIRLCAARIMFPDRTWPPPQSAPPWMQEVWLRLFYVIV